IIHRGVIGAGDIKELIDLPLATWLKAKYNLQITVENDMNLTSYGFYKKQNYDEDKTIAVVIFPQDNCSGAGIIVDGHIIRGNTNFAGEVSYLPFDHSQEQIKQINSADVYFPLMVKTIASIIAIINPETIVITGGLIRLDMMEDIYNACETIIPHEHMPQIIIQENMQGDYINGLISITLERLACDIQLIEKRI
ncbi:ROK family protein, partial [Sporomusa sp.]|uniref:ROK family protein n=1 Tax=Sporomusa sp. TaxID=2078658 RepID=UPI002C195901